MPPSVSSDSISALVELVAELVREKDETRRLLAEFAKGGISSEQIVNELAARYQSGVGGAVQALAEHDKDAALQLAERLRTRLDSALAEIASRGRPQRASSADNATGQSVGIAVLKDRDDVVLCREYVLVSAVSAGNVAARSADLIRAAKAIEQGLSDEAVTAHLIRLVNAGIIAKERKGRYHGTALSRRHIADLTSEIEARGLRLPPLPTIES